MRDDRGADEIFELTEEMASETEQTGNGSKEPEQVNAKSNVERVSTPPKPAGSPFTLLSEPRSDEEKRESRASFVHEAPERDSRQSFVPTTNSQAVLAVPIRSLGPSETVSKVEKAKKVVASSEVEEPIEETAPEPEAKPEPQPEAAAEPEEKFAPEPEEETAPEPEEEAAPEDDDDEVLELGQELIVQESPELVRDDPSEPIPLVTESMPPPPPPEDVEPAPAEEAALVATEETVEAVPEEIISNESEAQYDDDEPFELGEAHVLEDATPTEDSEDNIDEPSKEVAGAGVDSVFETEPGETVEPVQHPFDFGTPEMVFDATGGPEEEFEELSQDELEEDVEFAEELDVSELEDVSRLKPMSESFLEAAAQKSKTAPARPRRRKRRRKGEWWSQIFNDEYLMLLPPFTARDTRREVDFIQQTLGVEPGGLVLDLACWAGRHAVGMAQRNFRVVGVDLSLSMLARAGELAQESGQKINFIHGDMRDLGFDRTFDGVYCVDTSFGYFDEPTNLKVLDGVYKALKPGAPFMIELANRDFVIAQQPNMTWFQMENLVCMEETDFNYINSRLYITRQVILGNNQSQSRYKFSVRLYSLHEIGQMLHNSGFAVTKVSGNHATPGAFFGGDSSKIIILAERRR